MFELFYKYLIFNRRAPMPGIGGFSMEQIPAMMDLENKKLTPPTQSIKLSENAGTDNYSFYHYLATELNINESEAARTFQQFTDGLQKDIATNGSVHLPGVGILKKDAFANFVLLPEDSYKPSLPDLWIASSQVANTQLLDVYSSGKANIIAQPNQNRFQEVVLKKEREDYWWVYAIVLAIMGIGALLYYYI